MVSPALPLRACPVSLSAVRVLRGVRSGGSPCPVRGVVALAGVCVPLLPSALVLGGSRGSRSISALQAAYKVRVNVSGSYSADKGKAGGFLFFPCKKG